MLNNSIATGYGHAPTKEPTIYQCACGCKQEIEEGYEHINYDDEWFYDIECIMSFLKAEWRVVE